MTSPSNVSDLVLLEYQQRWCNSKSQINIWEKSRRIGASFGGAAVKACLHAAGKSGANVYYISYDRDMTRGFIDDCIRWNNAFKAGAGRVKRSTLISNEGRQVLNWSINFDSGHRIQTLSSSPRNLRSKGRPGEKLIIDEAAFVDDLDELLKSSLAMTMWGGSVDIISTHNGVDNPFNQLIEQTRAGKYDYRIHRTTLDDALSQGLYKKICSVSRQEWSEEKQIKWRNDLIKRYAPNEQEELFAIPAKGGVTYLPMELIHARSSSVAPVVRESWTVEFSYEPESVCSASVDSWLDENLKHLLERLNKSRWHAAGMDFARLHDLSVIVLLEEGSDLISRVALWVELDRCPFSQQNQIIKYIFDRVPRIRALSIDAGGNGASTAEFARKRYGENVVNEIMFTERFYRENMPRFKANLEDEKLVDIPADDQIRDDLR